MSNGEVERIKSLLENMQDKSHTAKNCENCSIYAQWIDKSGSQDLPQTGERIEYECIYLSNISNDTIKIIHVLRPVAKRFGRQKREFVSIAQVTEYLNQLTFDAAFNTLVSLVKRREYSCAQIRTKLSEYGYTSDVIEESIQRAKRVSLLNDMRFAECFIKSKLRQGWGLNRIEQSLKTNGIMMSDIPGYPDAFITPESEAERALKLLQRKGVPEKNPHQKLARYLVNKGFDYSVAINATIERIKQEECLSE
ncbi:MAG: regulatory protein RecX [Coriobacteriales bacterium]|nr:regulatory protein RecX [Coriobacteriales bacterium]